MILKTLSSRRMQEVLEKRFGLRGGGKNTLEAVGREYKITRERVRQIEAEALRQIRKKAMSGAVDPLIRAVHAHMADRGQVLAEYDLLSGLGDARAHPHILFLLTSSALFQPLPETDDTHKRWTTDRARAEAVEAVMGKVVEEIARARVCISGKELHDLVSQKTEAVLGMSPEERVQGAFIHTSKRIRINPYGEYGLLGWPMISPSGMRDKAYAALVKAGRPLHFLHVAQEITKARWSKKKAHPQTVHNELIKDSRFVLVGRGLYALKEWGYAPGPVRDVLAAVLSEVKRPMDKEEIIQEVLKKRFVKTPTILLNLQNRALFKKTGDGKYLLV